MLPKCFYNNCNTKRHSTLIVSTVVSFPKISNVPLLQVQEWCLQKRLACKSGSPSKTAKAAHYQRGGIEMDQSQGANGKGVKILLLCCETQCYMLWNCTLFELIYYGILFYSLSGNASDRITTLKYHINKQKLPGWAGHIYMCPTLNTPNGPEIRAK